MKATVYNGIMKVEELEGTEDQIGSRLNTMAQAYTTVVYEDEPGGYLPAWLDAGVDLFVDEDAWRMLYALGVDPGWCERWQRGLLSLLKMEPEADNGKWASPEADVTACVQYLKYTGLHKRTGKKLTSKSASLQHSFKDQLVDWLEDERPTLDEALKEGGNVRADECRFDSPYSPKQWSKVVRGRFSAYSCYRERVKRIRRQLEVITEAGDIWPAKVADLVPRYNHS